MVVRKLLPFISFLIISYLRLTAQDIMLQGWYWDYPKTAQGKYWVDTLALKAKKLSAAGFNYLWMPPMSKAAAGTISNGYDIFDYYNLGTGTSSQTGFGYRSKIDRMIDSLDKYNIVPIADMVYNHRVGGKWENNDDVEGWIENYNLTKHNNGDVCYPSDRFRCILPIGGLTGLGAGNYYFKVHSASQSADYYNKPYKFYISTKKKGWANLPDLSETANNGGADCGEGNDNIQLGRNIDAAIDNGGCSTDEFELDLITDDFFTAGDTMYISLTNVDGNYSDHFIYGLWYSTSSSDIQSQLKYQTATNFHNAPSGRGQMNYLNFKPNGNPTCLCGDWDGMLFYYDVDQYVPSTIDTLNAWTKWMMQDVGVKGLRIDAVKNFTPEFTGNLLDYLHYSGNDPKMIVGESYDYDAYTLKTRLDDVYSYMDQDTKDAMYYSLFDFNLQSCLRDACDAFGYDTRNVFGCGMHESQQIYRRNIVTFVNNHDFREASQAVDNDPILAYAYILTNPTVGIPCVYWADYFSSDHPEYQKEINNILSCHYNFIQGALDVDYLNRYNTPYASNYISGAASTSLIYQLSNMNNPCLANRDVVVAINFSGNDLKVDIGTNTSTPFHLQQGDTLVDVLGKSAFPYAIVNSSNQIYIDLPPRSYSIWARVSPITQTPAIDANGPASFCHGDQVTLSAMSSLIPCHTYQWEKDGQDIDGATGLAYVVMSSGSYQLSESYNGAMEHLSNVITVTVNPDHPNITSDGITLTCSVSNVFYQWYYGNTATSLTPITGAMAQQYVAPQSGYYAVVISDSNGCSDTSEVLQHWMVGIGNIDAGNSLELFPNPSGNTLYYKIVNSGVKEECKLVEVLSMTGKKMISISPPIEPEEKYIALDLTTLDAGIYFLKIILDKEVVMAKFEKELP